MPKQKTVNFTLVQSDQLGMTPHAVLALYYRLPVIRPYGVPLFFSQDGRTIGRLMEANLIEHVNGDGLTKIECKAVITDAQLLDQPWLRLDQIARSAIYFGLESVG